MAIPYKSKINPNASDPIDILFACGQYHDPQITYLDAWIAFQEIPKHDYTFYPNKDKQFIINKSGDLSQPAFKPRTYTLTGQEKIIGSSFKEEEKPDITFGIDGQAVLRDTEIESGIQSRLESVKDQRERNDFITGGQEKDYSLALKKIYDLIEKQEYERHGIGGKAMKFLGWKLPTSAAAVKHSIKDVLKQKANDKQSRKVLSSQEFAVVSKQIEDEISNKRTGMGNKKQSEKSWPEKLITTHRDDKTFELYDEIYRILQNAVAEYGSEDQPRAII